MLRQAFRILGMMHQTQAAQASEGKPAPETLAFALERAENFAAACHVNRPTAHIVEKYVLRTEGSAKIYCQSGAAGPLGDLTVVSTTTEGGYDFLRSDGMKFFSVYAENGSMALYGGADRDTPPQVCVVSFDANVSDKLNESSR
jgi:hypothetical protein